MPFFAPASAAGVLVIEDFVEGALVFLAQVTLEGPLQVLVLVHCV